VSARARALTRGQSEPVLDLPSLGRSLLRHDGELVCISGEKSQVIGALITSLWTDFVKSGSAAFGAEGLQFILLRCEVHTRLAPAPSAGLTAARQQDGQVGITSAGRFVLCLYAKADVQPGLLKAKVCAYTTRDCVRAQRRPLRRRWTQSASTWPARCQKCTRSKNR
jgi:hypothetical protein